MISWRQIISSSVDGWRVAITLNLLTWLLFIYIHVIAVRLQMNLVKFNYGFHSLIFVWCQALVSKLINCLLEPHRLLTWLWIIWIICPGFPPMKNKIKNINKRNKYKIKNNTKKYLESMYVPKHWIQRDLFVEYGMKNTPYWRWDVIFKPNLKVIEYCSFH